MGGKADTPAAPDYEALAKETAAGNLANTRLTTAANRPTVLTPYGNSTWSQDTAPVFDEAGYNAALKQYQQNPGGVGTAGYYETREGREGNTSQVWVPGTAGAPGAAPTREQFTKANPDGAWTQKISLSPSEQALLDQQNKTSQGLANLQNGAVDRVGTALTAQAPGAYDPTRDTNNATELINSRLLPQQERDRAALETQLSNQGLQRGTQAFGEASDELGRTQNDARQQAELAGINLGMNQQAQQYQQAFANRNAPLNELSAIRTGSQVTNPTFGSFAQQQYVPGADLSGAGQNQYNAAVASANAQNAGSAGLFGGLTQLGGLGIKAAGLPAGSLAGLFSDRRLKSDIELIGKLRGFNLYRYRIFGRESIGVMAQEVMTTRPDAVELDDSGYYKVRYGDL